MHSREAGGSAVTSHTPTETKAGDAVREGKNPTVQDIHAVLCSERVEVEVKVLSIHPDIHPEFRLQAGSFTL